MKKQSRGPSFGSWIAAGDLVVAAATMEKIQRHPLIVRAMRQNGRNKHCLSLRPDETNFVRSIATTAAASNDARRVKAARDLFSALDRG